MSELVSMFKCKQCGVRMFERDCLGHLHRHGLEIPEAKIRSHFEVGPADEHARPGDRASSPYAARVARKIKAAAVPKPDPDDSEIN